MSDRTIYFLQLVSICGIWGVVFGITILCVHLVRLAYRLNDSLNASVAISVVAITVFWTLGILLTYVFVALQKKDGKRFLWKR